MKTIGILVRLALGSLLLTLLICSVSHAQTCSNLEIQHDVLNCGSCGNDCSTGTDNANWACQQGSCAFIGCRAGYYDIDGDNSCEYACEFRSAQEACNGLDDDCDGMMDEDPARPLVSDACDISLSATTSECTTGVSLSCNNGSWQCTFPEGVCAGGCSDDDEICDQLDNDCDGALNENVPSFGAACRSDDGLAFPGQGRCATSGTYDCDGPDSVACTAVVADCSTLPGGCTEACDDVDNDCDGLVDESFQNPGSNPAHYIRPEVTRFSSNTWMFTYEASRPDASDTHQGYGNGYHCSGNCGPIAPAPVDIPLDQTIACSTPDRMPWSGVTPTEVEQTCNALGGFVCDFSDYQNACESTSNCDWGYSPAGAACTTSFSGSKYCNLSVSYDFDPESEGQQFGLLKTAASDLQSCWSDWGNVYAGNNQFFDMTGNLREIAKVASNIYVLAGGSYRTEVEAGASCDFSFMLGDSNYANQDAGFRCCFNQDPGL